jgi:hypothetical protein
MNVSISETSACVKGARGELNAEHPPIAFKALLDNDSNKREEV